MPYKEGIATLTDVGTEELSHLEMICAIIHQLTRNLSPEEIKKQGFAEYYVDHTLGVWPQAAGGVPFSSTFFQSKGDPITDLHENMAAEQKARTTYDNILRLTDDPDVLDPIRFLRQREITHFQRFGETLRLVQEQLDSRNFYAFNPAFDSAHHSGYNACTDKSDNRCGDQHADRCTKNCDDCANRYASHREGYADHCTDCHSPKRSSCSDQHPNYRVKNCDSCADQYSDCRGQNRSDCANYSSDHRGGCNDCTDHYSARCNNDCECGVTYNGNTGRIIKNG